MADPRLAALRAELLERTRRAQAVAADPAACAWVSANAGTGKTHVLKLRVLRLLLEGTPPDRILCLTYTKAAAAEMSARVFEELARWATVSEADLTGRVREVVGREPNGEEAAAARRLFARTMETPGGLKVQTIHAFCERLLQRFPLEAGVPPGFKVLDEATESALRREAIDAVLLKATRERSTALGKALEIAVAFAVEERFEEVLKAALAERDWLDQCARLALRGVDPFEAAAALYRRNLDVRLGIGCTEIDAELADVISEEELRRCARALSEGGPTDLELADQLTKAADATAPGPRIEALQRALLTQRLEPRNDARLVSNAVRSRYPTVYAELVRARDRFARLHRERQGLVTAEATAALLRIANSVNQHYSTIKSQRAVLDFDDLIRHSANLLAWSSAAQWVLYKLDGGLDHVLVDEAQDTSEPQWRVIEALAGEFFSGRGARETARTLFAVGDEKQSIYSFQGARPKMFAEAGERFAGQARLAGREWRQVPLTLSFRSVPPVLRAVDRVFADPRRTPGVSAGSHALRHEALRMGQGGLVEIWPTEPWTAADPAEPWSPLAESGSLPPANRLAQRIAATIAHWLRGGERLSCEDRPVRAGDILILVRKRRPFAGPMVAALKGQRIPVAGADRLDLTEQIAVMDLMALADFLTLPEDDLALAEALKSPLFGFDDDDLLALAQTRAGPLWASLLEAAVSRGGRFADAAATLKRWRALADLAPPYELFAGVLDRDGGRRRLLERLGSEAADPLTEFLSLALEYEEVRPASLAGFLDWLRSGGREIKRDMEHGCDEVRVLTVHGAKGLEAPIVFLPDTCSGSASRRPSPLVALGNGRWPKGPPPLVWQVKGAARLPAIKAARTAAANEEAEEDNRLLYVAMTRARDRLYVAGFEGARGRSTGCWYDKIEQGLADVLEQAVGADGRPVRRLEDRQTAEPELRGAADAPPPSPVEPPEWARRPAPAEPLLAVPIAPSRLAPLDFDQQGEPVDPHAGTRWREPPSPSPLELAEDHRFLRGSLTHALLEHLPTLPRAGWERAAKAFVGRRGRALAQATRESIVRETLRLLNDPAFAPVFGPTSRAEVPIVADIPSPRAGEPPLRLSGQIDRLVTLDHAIMILDYKTNRPPPEKPEQVAAAYLYQLAAYALAVRQVFRARQVRAAILWTDGPRLMEIPATVIKSYAERLWQLPAARLDG